MSPSSRFFLAVALGVSIASCDSSQSPAAPSAATLTGTWVGTGLFLSQDTLTFAMTQAGSSLTGTWTEGQGGPRGTLSGTSTGSNVTIRFSLTDSTSCPFPVEINGVWSVNRISGTYN